MGNINYNMEHELLQRALGVEHGNFQNWGKKHAGNINYNRGKNMGNTNYYGEKMGNINYNRKKHGKYKF